MTADRLRDHGGDIDRAIRRFGGARADWVDLSTGINPRPYPLPPIPPAAWRALPTRQETDALAAVAADAYGAAEALPLAGAQAAIQLIPRLRPLGRARVLGPTYNEHQAALENTGWQVETVTESAALAGADLAVVVNPNNPDGRRFAPDDLLTLAGRCGLLIVDESFADPYPDLSLAARIPAGGGVIALRSFGKFYGLAGLRLGFALGGATDLAALAALAGPWAVSGPAIAVGQAALADAAWRQATIRRLDADAGRLDDLARAAGWRVAGGTNLFRLYATPDATAAQDRLARGHVWSRVFPYADTWVRLGLPDGEAAWSAVETAFAV